MPLDDELHAHLSRFDTAPFLFVGSGMSRRYLGTEDWEALLRHFATYTGKPYERYRADSGGDLPVVASAIAESFRDQWWEADAFAESRALFPEPVNRHSPLKIEVARRMQAAMERIPKDGALFEEMELMKSTVVEGVITTNYDPLLDEIFDDFTVYAGQDELLFSHPQGVGEIYMIHGSASKPETLVLTHEDYKHFKDRNEYLAAKLLTIFVEHPVIFLGYSLSDKNIQEIIQNIAKVLTTENLHKLQDRLIFVQWTPQAVAPTLSRTLLAFDGLQIPIISILVSDFTGVFTALSRLKRRLPPKVLRQVKEQVYDLVSTSKSKGSLFVRDIAEDVDPSKIEIVIGVGIRQKLALNGLVGWSRMHLLNEVLNRDLLGNTEAMETVSTQVLQNHLMGGTNAPIYYYLENADRLDDNGNLLTSAGLHERVEQRAKTSHSTLTSVDLISKKNRLLAEGYASFADLALLEDPHLTLAILAAVSPEKIDLEELRQFLLDHVETDANGKPTTIWAKAVCLYDVLRHGPGRRPNGS
ncbi:SIR2 family protein [Pseudarthrobacter sp. AB1]|uniref:SIR2 family protein n=1 Tax=Pseudarthrobacter sp. AB1 TaxID=2138309 RepID=UPI00186B9966|nr:SIR2 family protein [Pseudarthrobacter sp. AB1]MBE4717274.1 hypothetical protein [Pseudarthrobacter sp. AB1]